MNRQRIVELFCLFIILCRTGGSFKLNVPKVLLPYSASTPIFTLEVTDPDGGCFYWKSSRPELVRIVPISNHGNAMATDACSSRANVSAISKLFHRSTAVVSAEDTDGGTTLRCDVIVDLIHSIEIVTTTRELYLDDSPEVFQVLAKNDQGDTFSELAGIRFDWSLQTDDGSGEKTQVLRIIPFSESKYETRAEIRLLEQKGLHGHLILMEGRQTGAAFVTVSVGEDLYRSVSSAKISLVVVAHLMLNPSWDVYLPVNALLHYTVEVIKFGRSEVVLMPSQQYYLELSDSTVASLDASVSVVTALEFGKTDIVLKDRNVKLQQQRLREPTSTIHVVAVERIAFILNGGEEWILENGRQYQIFIELFDPNGKKIYITENMRIRVDFPQDFLDVLHSSTNGSYHLVKTKLTGKTVLSASFGSTLDKYNHVHDVSPKIVGQQPIEIFEPIVVDPKIVLFPWDLSREGKYQQLMKAFGGSGKYMWSVANSRIAIIAEHTGLLTTLGSGMSRIQATDVRNRLNKGYAEVFVVAPTRLEFSPFSPVEVKVGDQIDLGVVMFGIIEASNPGPREMPFSNCSLASLVVHSQQEGLVEIVEALGAANRQEGSNETHCGILKLKGLKSGDVSISINYPIDASGQQILSAEIVVSVYQPLKILDLSYSVLMALGSSLNISATDGPRPWILDPSKYFAKASTNATDIVHRSTKLVKSGKVRSQVTCKAIGVAKLILKVGNAPCLSNGRPAVETVTIDIVCAVPTSLHLAPVGLSTGSETLGPCPLSAEFDVIPVYFSDKIEMQLNVKDDRGRQFDSVSSLLISWHSSDSTLLAVPEMAQELPKFRRPKTPKDGFTLEFFQTLRPFGQDGVVAIQAEISSYKDSLCTSGKCEVHFESDIKDNVQLLLTDHARFEMDFASVLNHPSNIISLPILKGSGYFSLISSATASSLANLSVKDRNVELTPIQPGLLIVQVVDVCLDPSFLITASIYISNLAEIELNGPAMTEVGKEIIVYAKFNDDRGSELRGDHVVSLLNPKVVVDGELIVNAKPELEEDKRMAIVLRGLRAGVTRIFVTSRKADGSTVSSRAHSVQVYTPLRLEPRNLTLLVGAKHQLIVSGGPLPNPAAAWTLHFAVNASETVSVDANGLIFALGLGHVAIKGQIGAKNFETQELEILSEDTVFVHVVLLSGIRLRTPLTTVESKTELPLLVVGRSDQLTPFSFSSFDVQPFEFDWQIDSQEFGSLISPYSKSNICELSQRQFSKRFRSEKQGVVVIKVTVKPTKSSKRLLESGARLWDSVTITILDAFALSQPAKDPGYLLLAPQSSLPLKVNRQHLPITWSVFSVTTLVGSPSLSVDQDGLLSVGAEVGKGFLMIEAFARSTGWNETFGILVEVKSVAFVMLGVRDLPAALRPLSFLPLGLQLHFEAIFCDNFGRRFDSANIPVEFDTNRNDLIELLPSSAVKSQVHVLLRQSGAAALKVSSKSANNGLMDLVAIDIESAIEPVTANDFTVGDVVCFSSSFSLPGDHWTSSNPQVFAIDSVNGNALAKAAGSAQIHLHSFATSRSIRAKVSVKEPNFIAFVASASKKDRFISSHSETPFVFPFTLKSSDTNITAASDCSHVLKAEGSNVVTDIFLQFYSCDLKWQSSSSSNDLANLPRSQTIFVISKEFRSDIGTYACVVKKRAHIESITDTLSTIEANLELTVSLQSKHFITIETLSASNELPFYPAFTVYQHELTLNNMNKPQALLQVSSSPRILRKLKIFATVEDVLMISPTEIDASGRLQHLIHLKADSVVAWTTDLTNLSIIIKSGLSGQDYRLPVNVKLYGDPPRGALGRACHGRSVGFLDSVESLWENYYSFFIYVLTVIVSLICLVIAYRFIIQAGPYATAVSGQQAVFATDNIHGGIPPSPASTANIKWRSYANAQTRPAAASSSPNGSPYLWSLNSFQNAGASPPLSPDRLSGPRTAASPR